MTPRQRRRTLAAGAVLVLVVLFAFSSARNQSILPGFEGMQNGIYGLQVGSNPTTTLGEPIPSPSSCAGTYYWDGSPTISSASVTADCNYNKDTLVADAQENPVLSTNPYTTGQAVNYYVPVPGSTTQYQYVTGQVEVSTYNLDISLQSGSSGATNFAGTTLWYNLYAEVWNEAVTDPNNASVTGQAFETPLYAVVTNVVWQHQGSSGVDAAVVGHALTFYSSPSTSGQTLATLANPTTQNVNDSLGSQYSPDSRFQRLVYYPIDVISLSPTGYNSLLGCDLGCNYPSVTVTVTLYTLRVGQYILTNPDKTQLQQRDQGCTGWACVSNGLGAWFSNPLNLLGLGVYGLLVVAVIVFVAVFSLTGSAPFLRGRGKKGE